MTPEKPGIYWIKTRIRYTVNDPPEGRQDWVLSEFDPNAFEWLLMGDETGTSESDVVVIGPEVIPPE